MLKYDQITGLATIKCDSCSQTSDSVANSDKREAMTQAAQIARLRNWAIERHAGTWHHYCPSCRKTRNRGPLL